MTHSRLKPWQRLPALGCETCGAQVTHRVYASGLVPVDPQPTETLTVAFSDESEKGAVLTCEAHAGLEADRLCDVHGGACSEPLRSDWRYWFLFTAFPPAGHLEAAIHNWRFDRAARRALAQYLADRKQP